MMITNAWRSVLRPVLDIALIPGTTNGWTQSRGPGVDFMKPFRPEFTLNLSLSLVKFKLVIKTLQIRVQNTLTSKTMVQNSQINLSTCGWKFV
jgi:hypothetical protein